jgi:hypothetical protein
MAIIDGEIMVIVFIINGINNNNNNVNISNGNNNE